MKLVLSKDVECVVRSYLAALGYKLSPEKKNGETGYDIVAIRKGEHLFIEVIGFQSRPPLRSREFYESFFRIISRDRGKHSDWLIIALPIEFMRGMKQRKRQYGIAWAKIGFAFPNLYIWYVDVKSKNILKKAWVECDNTMETESPDKKMPTDTHNNSLRGIVATNWLNAGQPSWALSTTIEKCIMCDEYLEEHGFNPAKRFREERKKKNNGYMKQWVLGCKFSWVKQKVL